MISLDAVLRRITEDLSRSGHACALVGGLGVSVRTEPRFTRDADLAVAVAGDEDAETLVMALRARGPAVPAIHLVQHWTEELKRLVSAK